MTEPRRQWDSMDDDVLLILRHNGRSADWIARFMCVHTSTIYRRAREMGIAFDGRHRWTAPEDSLLRRRYPDEQAAVIARDLGMRVSQVHQRAAKLGLHKSQAFKVSDRSGRILRGRTDPKMVATQFPKGHVPANKGLRRPGWYRGRMRETQFKKGRPAWEARNYVPIGTEKVDTKRGVLVRKLSDDPTIFPVQRWRPVHVLVWEANHGPVPAGHIVRFRDGMKTLIASEITADKLELVTLAENMRRNTVHRWPKDLVRLVQLKGALNRKINRHGRKQA